MSLHEYFLYNYSTNCPPTTFLRSHEFFALSVHILSPFSAILGIYGIIVIILATPKSMESAKWFILHLHLATFYIEIVINMLLMPFMFLPSGAIYATGVLMQVEFPFKLGHIIGQEAFPEYGIAILMLYENRHSSITSIPYRMTRKSTKILFYTIHYLLAMFILIIPYLEFVDDEIEKLNILVLNSLVVIVFSFHGIVSSVSLILLHKPYRKFTWECTIGRVLERRKPSHSQEISVKPSAVVVL
ncbi:unnamed protein product [Caenorhabditis brenneri]